MYSLQVKRVRKKKSILIQFTSIYAEAGRAGGGTGQRRTNRSELIAAAPWSVERL